MDKLAAMEALVRVVNAVNFSRAAESLGVAKASLTRQLQLLEAEVRTPLLNRTTRKMTMTEAGANYYERALQILADIDEMEGTVLDSVNGTPRGRLRVDVGATVGDLLIIPALADFHRKYPDITIDLGVSDRPIDLVGDNVDCVIRAGEVSDQSGIARCIGRLSMLMAASPEYAMAHAVPGNPDELERKHRVVNYVSHRTGRVGPWRMEREGELIEIRPKHTLAIYDSTTNILAGLSGLGIIRTTSVAASSYFQSGRLMHVLPDWTIPTLPIHIAYPSNRRNGARLRVFVDWIAERFQRTEAGLGGRELSPVDRPEERAVSTLRSAGLLLALCTAAGAA